MARDYRAEYRARQERARQHQFRSYGSERKERGRVQAERIRQQALGLGPKVFTQDEQDFPLTSEESPHGLQGPSGPNPDPAYDYYWPTMSSEPPRPRTLQARYSRNWGVLEILFRDGEPYTYYDVPAATWNLFKRTASPGKFMNTEAFDFRYRRGVGWGSIVGEGPEA